MSGGEKAGWINVDQAGPRFLVSMYITPNIVMNWIGRLIRKGALVRKPESRIASFCVSRMELTQTDLERGIMLSSSS